MNLNDYIAELEKIRDEHGGNVEVTDTHDDPVGFPEFFEADGDNPLPSVVICDSA